MMRLVGVALVACLAVSALRADHRLSRQEIQTPAPLPEESLLIVGFLGAWEEWDNPKRSVRRLALKLRDSQVPNVYVETADNHSRKTVRNFIREALDRDRDGKISQEEARKGQVICYGQSFGGAACVMLARELGQWGIPIRLTIQVDSIGRRDHTIPANVRRAVNLYQNDPGPIRGRSEIKAADPSKTTILGNFRHFYLFRDIDMSDYPPLSRKIGLSHWKMDNDPLVWAEVEGFLRAEIVLWQSEQWRRLGK